MRCLLDHSKIRRPESACSSNNLMQNPNHLQNPKSKIQDPKSKIQTAAFGAATKRVDTTTIQNPNPKSKIQNPKSKIQNPKSKIQNPKSKIQNPRSKIQNPNKIQTPKSKRLFWILDFGVWIWGGRAGAGGDGYVANALVWAGWPPEFGVVGGDPSLRAKGRGLDSLRAHSKLGTGFWGRILLETRLRFPAACRGNRGPLSRKMVDNCGAPSSYSMGSTPPCQLNISLMLSTERSRSPFLGMLSTSRKKFLR